MHLKKTYIDLKYRKNRIINPYTGISIIFSKTHFKPEMAAQIYNRYIFAYYACRQRVNSLLICL